VASSIFHPHFAVVDYPGVEVTSIKRARVCAYTLHIGGFEMRTLIENLEGRLLFAITTTTTVVKQPGPKDTVVVTATNPAGNQAVGQNDTFSTSNKDAKQYK
jgi:hypothetical protein